MRKPITQTVDQLQMPDAALRVTATDAGGDAAAHAGYLRDWPCLNSVEYRAGDDTAEQALTIAAWNIERCKRVEDAAALIAQTGADIVLATEMDLGMARSSQRHTTRDLADALGMGYAFGVEFVELGLGDPFETETHTGQTNLHGLHGNAILSRFPLSNVAVIPVADEGYWFATSPKGDGQYRVGGRMAIAAQVDLPGGPLTLAAVHYESEDDATGRAAQTQVMLRAMQTLYGDGPCVIGGDLNTKDFGAARMTGPEILAAPQPVEPSFAHFAAAGFDWRGANTGAPTTRAAPGRPVRYPLNRLDWLFTRGVTSSSPFVHAAVSERGEYLSDHELIGTRIES
ncbi:hypothetical protein ACMU_10875 [Actibacterium mucosum KCTC 23349]|uniref:Endonuclease/exonuclease/phosphatase domain-containing protein n=1 Tax=Actibacterium mucosum KCTC 23349 TaxID=1454373 RepID=A0A037ZL27_9RHOB|nr:endonuclease/exonuclease/phosphatase family protein [Actibacterium mucosum]KAJ56247.1 hypothetical protein ACMU_10875 [Actibacterium mucosum KCTC 23349]